MHIWCVAKSTPHLHNIILLSKSCCEPQLFFCWKTSHDWEKYMLKIYPNTNFTVGLSLFSCELNILYKVHIVHWCHSNLKHQQRRHLYHSSCCVPLLDERDVNVQLALNTYLKSGNSKSLIFFVISAKS